MVLHVVLLGKSAPWAGLYGRGREGGSWDKQWAMKEWTDDKVDYKTVKGILGTVQESTIFNAKSKTTLVGSNPRRF